MGTNGGSLSSSYLGCYLLDIFTLGILGIFYVSPYYYAAQTEVYRHLRECALAEGIATPEDLPAFRPPFPRRRLTMRRILPLLLCFFLLCSLAACGEEPASDAVPRKILVLIPVTC